MMKVIVKTLIFTIIVPGTVAVYLPSSMLPSGVKWLPDEIGVRWLSGVFLIAVGAAFYVRCALDFAFAGHGTPAPIDPPTALVSRGLYRRVRNPMYVGVVSILIGESIAFESLVLLRYAAIVWLVFHLVVFFYEEPTLKKTFGSAYEEYCKTVPRWIPRLRISPAQQSKTSPTGE
jgi:protein-S-isoprenylcysteine O-methyltransferase Ste14